MSSPGNRSRTQLLAVVEVLLAFLVMHVSMRCFKHFTYLGQLEAEFGMNASPGVTMILVSAVMMRMTGLSLREAGLVAKVWPDRPEPLSPGTVAVASTMMVVMWCVGLRVATNQGTPLGSALLVIGGRFFAVGFGEEAFFRGYVQSRLNGVFERRWSYAGAQYGPGLFLSSALFGFLHALNTVDYFSGHWNFAWAWGAGTLLAGLFYGYLRELTGGVLLGALVHSSRGLLSPLLPHPLH